MFERLDSPTSKPYTGTFQDEENFSGMASYHSIYSAEIQEIEEKVDHAKEIERTIYGNVLQLMAIFVGIFSLVNVNTVSIINQVNIKTLISLNLTSVGSIGFLLGAVQNNRQRWIIWTICAIAFLGSIVIQFLP